MIPATPAASPAETRPIDRAGSLWTLLIATSINEAMLLILPSFVGALSDDLKLSADRIGLLASADLIGIAVSTATGPLWLRRLSWRRIGIGALIAYFLLNAACLGQKDYSLLMTLRFLAGLVAGVGYTVGLAGVMDTKRPDRSAGLLLVVEVIFSAMGLYVIDVVPVPWRLDAVYLFILAWLVPCIVIAWRHYPDDPGGRVQATALRWRSIALRGSAVVAGAGIYFLMIGGVWGYLEGIAREAGLTLAQTGQALSLGLLISLAGAGAAAFLGLRLGRAVPLIVSAVVQVISLYLLTQLSHFSNAIVAFYVINAVFQIMWSYIIPYFMIMFDEVEPTGRFVSMYGMVTHLTLAIGPYMGAFFIVNGHHGALLWLGIPLVVLCYAAFLLAVWLGRRAGIGQASPAEQTAQVVTR